MRDQTRQGPDYGHAKAHQAAALGCDLTTGSGLQVRARPSLVLKDAQVTVKARIDRGPDAPATPLIQALTKPALWLDSVAMMARSDWARLLQSRRARLLIRVDLFIAACLSLYPGPTVTHYATTSFLVTGFSFALVALCVSKRRAGLFHRGMPVFILAFNLLHASADLSLTFSAGGGQQFNSVSVVGTAILYMINFAFFKKKFAIALNILPLTCAILGCMRQLGNVNPAIDVEHLHLVLGSLCFSLLSFSTGFLFITIIEKYNLQLLRQRFRIATAQASSAAVTERLQSRQLLARYNRSATLTAMTTAIARDLVVPLRDAQLAVTAARRHLEGPSGADSEEATGPILTGAAERIRVAGHILVDVRTLTNRPIAEHSLVDMAELARECVELCAGELALQGIGLTGPDHAALCLAFGCREEIGQAILNLISNAAGSFATSQPVRSINLTVDRDHQGWIVLTVFDNGKGMDQDALQRAIRTSALAILDGIGLGLAICREIAEAHGGSLLVSSQPNEGTTARLFIPEAGR